MDGIESELEQDGASHFAHAPRTDSHQTKNCA